MDQINRAKEEVEKVLVALSQATGGDGLNAIDRDLILEHLRRAYETVSCLEITRAPVVTNVNRSDIQPITDNLSLDRRELIESLYGEKNDSEKTLNETAPPVNNRLSGRISLNDRLMLLEDVFFNDENLCDRTLSKLDKADTVDDAYIYLYENFTLDDSKEGVRLLISLLESKFA